MFGFLKRRGKDPKAALRRVLGDFELPSFPAAIADALKKLRNPDVSACEASRLLAADPGLSVRLLKTVNSAAYALRRKITSVEQAVILLGLSTVESLVVSVAVADLLPTDPSTGFERQRFWRTAARRAATGRALAERLDPTQAAESFTASLLQDMAVPLLATRRSDVYGPILEHWHHGSDDLAVLEQAELGWSHAEVATWQCAEWDLPEPLAAAIGGHHGDISESVAELDSPPAVALVAHLREHNDLLGIDRLVATAEDTYNLPPDETRALIQSGFEDADDLARLFAPSPRRRLPSAVAKRRRAEYR